MIKAKKKFGQNWLIDESVIADMIDAAKLTNQDLVLEIGPGQGILTAKLLQAGARVIAIEKDRDLIPFLQEKFAQEIKNGQLVLIEEDIRDLDIGKTVAGKPYQVIANIPYYLSGFIIRFFLTAKKQPTEMILLVQREVADRIIANDKKESLLSTSVKAYGRPAKIRNVKAGAFRPIPKVNSAVIHIKDISREFFKEHDLNEAEFFEVVRSGFAQKRKTLGAKFKNLPPEFKGKRAESLTLDNWIEIIRNLNIIE